MIQKKVINTKSESYKQVYWVPKEENKKAEKKKKHKLQEKFPKIRKKKNLWSYIMKEHIPYLRILTHNDQHQDIFW